MAGASASVLTSAVLTTSSGAGGTGGQSTNCMIGSDGTAWSGGAAGIVGSASINNAGASPLAGSGFVEASTLFKFNVGSLIDSYNAAYGAGNWLISNVKLTFQYTLYANNPRFGAGAGTFDTYWVSDDSWVTGTNNPGFADSEETLLAWTDDASLLASSYFDWTTPNYTGTYDDLKTSVWTTDKSGDRQSLFTINLGGTSSFLDDMLSASASSNPDLSFYLMPTSEMVGICIFTGGSGSSAYQLPTLTFDVVSVPEPGTIALVAVAASCGFYLRARRKS